MVQLREPEVQYAAGTVLLARNRSRRGKPAHRVRVHPKVLRRFARREPAVVVVAGYGKADRDARRDPVGQRIQEIVQDGDSIDAVVSHELAPV
jgi:hypothetical protein